MKKQTKNPESRTVPLLMSAHQMSAVSGIGENTLRRLMDERQIEYLQIGSHRLLCEAAIWDYYRRNKVPASVPAAIAESSGAA